MQRNIYKGVAVFVILSLLIRLSVVSRTYAAPENPGTNDLISWWSMDEAEGETRMDAHGNNDLEGAASQCEGKIGNAMYESRASLPLSHADNDSLSIGTAGFTIGGWVRADTISGYNSSIYRTLVHKTSYSSIHGTSENSEYLIRHMQTKVEFYLATTNNGWKGMYVSDGFPEPGWYFVIAWYDPATPDTLYLQIDDTTYSKTSSTYTAHQTDSTADIQFGGRFNTHGLDGALDEWFLYKRALSENERMWLYNNGLGRSYFDVNPPPTATPTATSTSTPTLTPSPTATSTLTPLPTKTGQPTSTLTPVWTATATQFNGATETPWVITVPVVIEIRQEQDVTAGGSGGSGSLSSYAVTPTPPFSVGYGGAMTNCNYALRTFVYVDENNDQLMSPTEGAEGVEVILMNSGYDRLGNRYTKEGQAVFCLNSSLYGKTVQVEIPYLHLAQDVSISANLDQDVEVWFRLKPPTLPLYLP